MPGHPNTPAFLVDLSILEANMKRTQADCEAHGKQLWPMTKTHKSRALTRMQKSGGAAGFLTGTLDEAEAILREGLGPVMLAYPVMGEANLLRVAQLTRLGRVLVSVDTRANAYACHAALRRADARAEALVIIDTGIGRLGVSPEDAPGLLREIHENMPALSLFGLSSHPGHAYSASGEAAFAEIARRDGDILHALRTRANAQLGLSLVTASGATPTFRYSVLHPGIDILRPGVYPFYDAMQVGFGAASASDCALSVMAHVISKHNRHLIINCGSKCLGLDKGAHGVSSVKGHGILLGHPECTLAALSEEVGRVEFEGETALSEGDTVRIVPNHACSAVNMSSYLIGMREDTPEMLIPIDMRGNSRAPSL